MKQTISPAIEIWCEENGIEVHSHHDYDRELFHGSHSTHLALLKSERESVFVMIRGTSPGRGPIGAIKRLIEDFPLEFVGWETRNIDVEITQIARRLLAQGKPQ